MPEPSAQILVVDDTPANLVAAEAALTELGRPLVMASSGQEALARLLEQDFSLALLDVQMPGMNGLELARLIRGRPRSSHLPIIFITAFEHDQAAVLNAYGLGAVDFLVKPVLPEILRAKASSLISLQERTEELAYERQARIFDHKLRTLEVGALRKREDSFLAMLSHELRNPLAPIRSSVDLLRLHRGQPPSDATLDVLDRQTTVLTRLVDDLMDLGRLEADKVELRRQPVEVSEVIGLAMSTTRPHAEKKSQSLVASSIPAVTVTADAVRLEQVLTSLITNAVQYTPAGGSIDVRVISHADHVVFEVADTGMGIPLELQASIFEPFIQERVSSAGSGGLGLGLALAKRLVDLHGGSISVVSAGRDRGSTFAVTIPVAAPAAAAGSAKTFGSRHGTPRPAPVDTTAPPQPLRVVIVDDNDDARELLSALLTASGYQVHQANDGASGIQLVDQIQPDVALVDLGLPDMTGIDVVETLLVRKPVRHTRFVALTGYGDATIRSKTKTAGFHAHFAKPISAATILGYLRSVATNAN